MVGKEKIKLGKINSEESTATPARSTKAFADQALNFSERAFFVFKPHVS